MDKFCNLYDNNSALLMHKKFNFKPIFTICFVDGNPALGLIGINQKRSVYYLLPYKPLPVPPFTHRHSY